METTIFTISIYRVNSAQIRKMRQLRNREHGDTHRNLGKPLGALPSLKTVLNLAVQSKWMITITGVGYTMTPCLPLALYVRFQARSCLETWYSTA
jgi:hypothetical protein